MAVFIIGSAGNILILLVMTRKRMRGSTTSDYLTVMALAHLSLLTVGIIPSWLRAMNLVVYEELHPITCKLNKFCNYAFGDIGIWIIVLFTVDRCVMVCNPLRKNSWFPPRNVKWNFIGVIVLATVKNAHTFWTRGPQFESLPGSVNISAFTSDLPALVLVKKCGYPTPEYKYFEYYIRPWLALILVNILPCSVISICNIFIIRAMLRLKKLTSRQSRSSDQQYSLVLQRSAMCLAASFSFIVCVTPTIVLTVGKPYWTKQANPYFDIAKAANNVFFYVNYSTNIFLYCLTGRNFRITLLGMFSKRKVYQEQESTMSEWKKMKNNDE